MIPLSFHEEYFPLNVPPLHKYSQKLPPIIKKRVYYQKQNHTPAVHHLPKTINKIKTSFQPTAQSKDCTVHTKDHIRKVKETS